MKHYFKFRELNERTALIDYNIRVMSVMEPIMLHTQSPFFFQFRTQMLLGAQVEWMVIRDRAKLGNHQAAKAGRYINMAPFGYKNAKDASNKPILIIDEPKAKIVCEIYEKFLSGDTVAQLRIFAKDKGYLINGKSMMQKMLTIPTYRGLIRVPGYYDEPERMVKEIH